MAVLAGTAAVPYGFHLSPNYPNPFNPSDPYWFQPRAPFRRALAVYNSLGHLVYVLLDGQRPPGRYRVAWHGRDRRGFGVAAGVYFYRLEVGSSSQTRKMTLIDGTGTLVAVAPAKTALPAQPHPDLFSVLISAFGIETLALTGQKINQCQPLNFEVMRIRDPIVFEDPFLFSSVRRASQALEGEITLTDVAGVTSLEEINSIVTSLGGIEILTRLKELRVSLNRISDLSPLAGLPNLRHLSIGTNNITDISSWPGWSSSRY